MYQLSDLMDFLAHAGEKGLMPAATAQALAVAVRRVLDELLDAAEKNDVRQLDVDAAIRRFNNKRAGEFKPDSLREYQRRVRRAVDLFLAWRDNPATFKPTTRTQRGNGESRKRSSTRGASTSAIDAVVAGTAPTPDGDAAGKSLHYSVVFPVRPGQLIGLNGIPYDLTVTECERMTQFVRSLVVRSD